MNTYPLLFDNLLVPYFPDSPGAAITYDPQQWLQAIIEQADHAISIWVEHSLDEDDNPQGDGWPVSSRHYCSNARESAQKALQALSCEDIDKAMLCAFQAGIFIERARRDFPIEDWLQLSKKAGQGGDEGRKKQAELAEKRRVEVIRLFHEFIATDTPARNTTAKIKNRLKGTKLKLGSDQINKILKKARLK